MIERRNDFIAEVTDKLHHTSSRIRRLEARTCDLKDDARARLQAELAAARNLRDTTYQRVQEMRLDGPKEWIDTSREIEQACASVSSAVEKAAGRLQ